MAYGQVGPFENQAAGYAPAAYDTGAQKAAAYAQSMSNQLCGDRVQTPLELVRDRLGAAVNQASVLSEQLSILEGRLMGGGSAEGKSSPPRPMPTGFIGQSNATLDELFGRLETCLQTARRLSESI
jgi:hypothetical protein